MDRRSILVAFAAYAGAWAVLYSAVAFSEWAFNPGAWDASSRGLVAFFGVIVGPFVALGAAAADGMDRS